MSIALIKQNYLIFSSAYKPWTNLFKIIKCSFLLVISWLGAIHLEKLKRILLHLLLKKELKEAREQDKLLLHHKKNQSKKKEQLKTKANKKFLRKKLSLKSQLNTLFIKMETLLTEYLCLNTIISRRYKIKFFQLRKKMSKFLWFALVLSMGAEKTLFMNFSKLVGSNNLKR